MRISKALLMFGIAASLIACSDSSTRKQQAASEPSRGASGIGEGTGVRPPEAPTASGTASRDSGNAATQQKGAAQSDVVSSAMDPNQELANRVRVAITTGSTGTTGVIAENMLTAIQVEAKDGEVTLSGPVQSENEKKVIGKRVSGLSGVKKVNNNLTISNSREVAPYSPKGPGTEKPER